MRRLILGTAGHIDHGKTALVKALTGVDTDRLKEEKERGITVDLGFAEYQPREDVLFGVVDVPGHEGFIRNMLAGATGMDLVLLVVAADEGVMPQTREHFSIVRLLGVPRLAVAITKADLAEAEWLELVEEEVRELLEGSSYENAPIHAVSSMTGEGLPELGNALATLGEEAEEKGTDDVVRLPIDRVFTIKGAGTVVTGTLWTGKIQEGGRVKILPGTQEARIRSIQVHGQEVPEGRAGARVAVGLSGTGVGHHEIDRGQVLVEGNGWESSWMLTSLLSLISDSGWELEQGQRVRVHLGTSEVLARVALFDRELLRGGEEGWAQLRLEEPVLARVGDHLVIRSYSPVTTMGGGRVAEVLPRKRRRLLTREEELLRARLAGSTDAALESLLEMSGWAGAPAASLPHRTGCPPSGLLEARKVLIDGERIFEVDRRLYSGKIWREGKERLLSALETYHERNPLRPGIPLEELRQGLPADSGQRLSDAILQSLAEESRIKVKKGTAWLFDFRPSLTEAQAVARGRLLSILGAAGLGPPSVKELGEALGMEADIPSILSLMEEDGEVVNVDGDFFFHRDEVHRASLAVIEKFAGADNLGPADFREVLPVTRRHLLPLLRFFDLLGVTTRIGDQRKVAEEPPPLWGGTPGSAEP